MAGFLRPESVTMSPLQIEVFADIACPWCYIGEHRLEHALAARPELQVEWRWRPFQLQPNLPAQGLPWDTFASAKFGGAARAQSMFEQVASVGAEEGIQFAFDRVATAPNTADAHRLILFAQETGRQRDAALAVFRAYFAEGADLNDLDTLTTLGQGVGLDAASLREHLQEDSGLNEVGASQEEAQRLGITGVPFYIFNERFGLSGAQPAEVFLRALDLAVQQASTVDA